MELDQLRTLLEKHSAALVLYARQWCATPEDVVQEALIKLVRQRTAPEKLLPWLYRVVRNGAISACRSELRRRHHESQAATKSSSWFINKSEDHLDAETATEALQGLPLEQREVLVARLWSGLTFAEIGELTGTSSSTTHRIYEAALKELRERLNLPCPSTTTLKS